MSALTTPHELFFSRALDPDRARKRYRALSLVLHPDCETGDTRLMATLNAEYDAFQHGTLRPAQATPPPSPPPQANYNRAALIERAGQRLITSLPLSLRQADLSFRVLVDSERIVAEGAATYEYRDELKRWAFKWDALNRVWFRVVIL